VIARQEPAVRITIAEPGRRSNQGNSLAVIVTRRRPPADGTARESPWSEASAGATTVDATEAPHHRVDPGRADGRKAIDMTTAVIGVGNIGGALARHLVRGGEPVVVAARNASHAEALAQELGELARPGSVDDAIASADVVVLTVWLDTMREIIAEQADRLTGKVVVDPSNPIGFDENGNVLRTLPEGQSAGSLVAGRLPPGAHYVKAFGTLGADSLATAAHRAPRRAVLFYATDDDAAAAAAERLIAAAGFEPVKAGGVADAGRIEVPGGDLHENGGLQGRLLDLDEARAAVTAGEVPA
jgi:hypothetical protein